MNRQEVSTQAELDALSANTIAIVRDGRFVARGSAHVEARGSAHVVAWGFAHVVAGGSAHVEAEGSAHVVAWDSAHVEAWGFAHVEARGSAHVEAEGSAHVEARGSAHVVARGSAHVEASKFVTTHRLSELADVHGGVIIDVRIDTGEDWCEFHGVTLTDGKAVVFKAVDAHWQGRHKHAEVIYEPGRVVEARDWDPTPQCGNGLHLSPHPRRARDYHVEATRYVACEITVAEAVLLNDKVKVPSCRVLHEVTIDATRVEVTS